MKIVNVIKDFLIYCGISSEKIFCSSLPGYDVTQNISNEIKCALQTSKLYYLFYLNHIMTVCIVKMRDNMVQ